MSKHKEQDANSFFTTAIARRHSFYISGVIKPAEYYTSMIHVIRTAQPQDEINIHINSGGGNMDAAMQITNAMRECQANILTSVEGSCMSAATIIFLAANLFQISEHSIFMFHNYTSGTYGKGGEQFDQIVHERAWSKKLLKSVYKDFLTKKEIKAILDNKDIYMDSKEAAKRLENRLAKYKEKTILEVEAE